MKKLFVEDPKKFWEKIETHPVFNIDNNFLLLKKEFHQLENEAVKGTISKQEELLRTNQLTDRLFNLIDQLERKADTTLPTKTYTNNYQYIILLILIILMGTFSIWWYNQGIKQEDSDLPRKAISYSLIFMDENKKNIQWQGSPVLLMIVNQDTFKYVIDHHYVNISLNEHIFNMVELILKGDNSYQLLESKTFLHPNSVDTIFIKKRVNAIKPMPQNPKPAKTIQEYITISGKVTIENLVIEGAKVWIEDIGLKFVAETNEHGDYHLAIPIEVASQFHKMRVKLMVETTEKIYPIRHIWIDKSTIEPISIYNEN